MLKGFNTDYSVRVMEEKQQVTKFIYLPAHENIYVQRVSPVP